MSRQEAQAKSRCEWAESLGRRGVAARSSVPALLDTARHDDAAYSTGEFFTSSRRTVRSAAFQALGQIGGPEAVEGLAAIVREGYRATEGKRAELTRAACEALGRIGPDARNAVPDLLLPIDAANRSLQCPVSAPLWALERIVQLGTLQADSCAPILERYVDRFQNAYGRPEPEDITRARRLTERLSGRKLPTREQMILEAGSLRLSLKRDSELRPSERALVLEANGLLGQDQWAGAEEAATRAIDQGIRSIGVYRIRAHARAEQGRWAGADDDFSQLAGDPWSQGYRLAAASQAGRSSVPLRYLAADLGAMSGGGVGYPIDRASEPTAVKRYYPYDGQLYPKSEHLGFLVWLPCSATAFADLMIVAQDGKQAFNADGKREADLIAFLAREPQALFWTDDPPAAKTPPIRCAIYERLGLHAQAVADFEASATCAEIRVRDRLFYAMALEGLGRTDEARRQLEGARRATTTARRSAGGSRCDETTWYARLVNATLLHEAEERIEGDRPSR